jgi:hypothetical protein
MGCTTFTLVRNSGYVVYELVEDERRRYGRIRESAVEIRYINREIIRRNQTLGQACLSSNEQLKSYDLFGKFTQRNRYPSKA